MWALSTPLLTMLFYMNFPEPNEIYNKQQCNRNKVYNITKKSTGIIKNKKFWAMSTNTYIITKTSQNTGKKGKRRKKKNYMFRVT